MSTFMHGQCSRKWKINPYNNIAISVNYSWWRHQTEAFSTLLALCVGNSAVTGEFPSQRAQWRGECFHLMTSSCIKEIYSCMSAFINKFRAPFQEVVDITLSGAAGDYNFVKMMTLKLSVVYYNIKSPQSFEPMTAELSNENTTPIG